MVVERKCGYWYERSVKLFSMFVQCAAGGKGPIVRKPANPCNRAAPRQTIFNMTLSEG